MKPQHSPLCDLYIAHIPDTPPTGELFPPERAREVNEIQSERAKKEKYYAWRLLEYALARSLGLDAKNLAFFKDENGKWWLVDPEGYEARTLAEILPFSFSARKHMA